MGTTYNIVIVDSDDSLDHSKLLNVVETTLKQVDGDYSNWNPTSEVSRFNAQLTTEPVPVSDGFRDMMVLANHVHEETGGTFDLTLTPVIDLWGFGPSGTVTKRPDAASLAAAMQTVGQDQVVELSEDGEVLRKTTPNATVYLTALAKGYGIDKVAQSLSEQGANNFMVEIGGDLYVTGKTSRDSNWSIGIERPDAILQSVEEVIEFSDAGMATSGDYRNYFEQDGVRYSHIIDGVSGQPISHRTASVTVIADTATEADAWATALLAVGAERGLEIAVQNDLDALFIVRQNANNENEFELISTPGFEKFRKPLKD
ncbi:MAG: FAD:protein FMN transferase [Pseudomonadota bacterium]